MNCGETDYKMLFQEATALAECIKKDLTEAVEKVEKRESEIEELQRNMEEQARQIENLKGQISAYQYALNCRNGRY